MKAAEVICDKGQRADPRDLDGPEVPVRIPGHSGERWLIDGGFDPRSVDNRAVDVGDVERHASEWAAGG